MTKLDWKDISKEHVIKAIENFYTENPQYPAPKSTFLIYKDKKLPAKHIRGMAYKVCTGKEISKNDFSGGMETVRFFERLGFEVHYTGTQKRDKSKCVNVKEVDGKQVEEKELKLEQNKTTSFKVLKEENKIKISSKSVIEQKNALQLLLNKLCDGDVVCEKVYPWLKTPEKIEDEYMALFNAISSYRGNKNFVKKNVTLRCDFVCEGKRLIIEYDERQHFTEARKVALESYQDISLYYDKDLWIKACTDIQAKDNQPANRDEVRAYYDSTRDIEAAKQGYRLVRIMHGQIDFESPDAIDKLKELLKQPEPIDMKKSPIKIAMYLQADQCKNQKEFDKAIEAIKKTDADILVFPEYGWVPFNEVLEDMDVTNADEVNKAFDACFEFSEEIDRAVIISSMDAYGTIYSIYANAKASGEETECTMYIKHTMTDYSAFEFENYPSLAPSLFTPIVYKNHLIGMTICYDCTHALFSRIYGVQGVDIIINSTGGNVVYDKWFKYNKSRAIENQCYTFITMGGDGKKDKVNSYVYGFNPKGKEMSPHLVNGHSDQNNIPGGIYIYDLADDDGGEETENSINQLKTENKYQDFYIPVGNVDLLLKKAVEIESGLYIYKHEDINMVFCVVEDDDIFSAEQFLPRMYSEKLNKYDNRRYVLVSKYKELGKDLYTNQLSIVLKVRAMENFCAVILESEIANNCYQTGKSKTAQVLKEDNGMYGLDLSRMTGPEAIWKNKGSSCKASWRTNFTWLANKCKYIADNQTWE